MNQWFVLILFFDTIVKIYNYTIYEQIIPEQIEDPCRL